MKRTDLNQKELTVLYNFIDKYGCDSLMEALQDYEVAHHFYLYKTKSSVKKIPIPSINYIEIFGHDIIIHTTDGDYAKYGTLKMEYAQLKKQGFVKCNQSFLIPINKISKIEKQEVILTTGETFILSRSCTASVIHAYTNRRNPET